MTEMIIHEKNSGTKEKYTFDFLFRGCFEQSKNILRIYIKGKNRSDIFRGGSLIIFNTLPYFLPSRRQEI